MGVPILFSWLNQKHSNCINKEPPKTTENLYIDFNALVHNCYNPNLKSNLEIYNDTLKRLKKAIDNIVIKTKPTKLLYIAVDGVAPAAKLSHQRARRYKAACDKQKNINNCNKNILDGKLEDKSDLTIEERFILEDEILQKSENESKIENFDSNSITPGTEFMEFIHKGVLDICRFSLSHDKNYKHLKIIYSSYLVPGEGEQKIMNFIRKYHIVNPKDTHTMYSPDGDIIFLGVGLYDVNLYIMREDTYNNQNKKNICEICSKIGHISQECGEPKFLTFAYIDVPEFRNTLINLFSSIIKKKYDYRQMLTDWVFMCFLIGNDFLPGIPCVDIKISSIETLTNLLCKNYLKCNDFITTNQKMINFHILEKYFISLSRIEDSLYISKTKMLNKSCEAGREEIPLHTYHGKAKYYSTKLYANNQDDIDNIAIEYITGMIWIYNYYINGRTDWQWVYPYHFAPFVADLAKVVRANFSLKRGSPLHPFEQLLVVIPPQSQNLVVEKLRYIYNKFKIYYPTEVKSDSFDKYLTWTSVVLLPHMNSKAILNEYKKVINDLTAQELLRNSKEMDLLIVNDENLIEKLKGLYFDFKPAVKLNLEGINYSVFAHYNVKYPNEEVNSNFKSFKNKTISVRFESF